MGDTYRVRCVFVQTEIHQNIQVHSGNTTTEHMCEHIIVNSSFICHFIFFFLFFFYFFIFFFFFSFFFFVCSFFFVFSFFFVSFFFFFFFFGKFKFFFFGHNNTIIHFVQNMAFIQFRWKSIVKFLKNISQ